MRKSLDAEGVNNSKQAIGFVSKAIELDGQFVGAIDWRATLYKAEGLKALQDEDNIEKARMYYQKAINDYLRIHEIEPKDVDSLLGISTVYFEQKDYVQSKKYVDEALGIDPNNTDARKMSRGLVRLINKQSSPGQ